MSNPPRFVYSGARVQSTALPFGHTRFMETRLLTVQHSADGELWWDGAAWRPAFTADRADWFDGTRWVAQPGSSGQGLTRSEVIIGALLVLWLISWVAWAIWATSGGHLVPDGQINFEFSKAASVANTWLTISWLAFAFVVAFWLSWRRRWVQVAEALGAMIAVTVSVYVLMVFLMLIHGAHGRAHVTPATYLLGVMAFGALALLFEVPPLLAAFGVGAGAGAGLRKLLRRGE